MRIAITGPTGNVGRKLVHELLNRNHRDLLLLTRDPDKLAEEHSRGAIIVHGDLTDQDFVISAFRNVDAVFFLIPPNPLAPNLRTYQDAVARIGASAAQRNNVQHVVLLSSLGADHPQGTGPITGLHDAETIFQLAVPSLTILRPALFMDNYLSQLDTIQHESAVFLPVSGNVPMPMIATADIAKAAADALLSPPPRGTRLITLVGPKQYTFDEAASIISQTLGRPIHHIHVSDDQARTSLLKQGASPNVAEQLVQMYGALDHGPLLEPPPPDAISTPTTFEQFATVSLKPAISPS